MAKVTGEPLATIRRPEQAHKDMASSVQAFTELVMEDFVRLAVARPERRSAIVSALHVDGTSRLHTVSRADHPRLARVLDLLVERGHPLLLIDTSFDEGPIGRISAR